MKPTFSILNLAAALVTLTLTPSSSAQTSLKLPEGMSASLFARDEMLANPVAIAPAPGGRVYIAETHRNRTGVWGVTYSRWWAMEDYGNRTLADREAMYERWAHQVSPAMLAEKSDIIRLVRDSDGDGVADVSTVFADGFDSPLSGNAAGVLDLDGDVYVTCVPDLVRLRDDDGDGREDSRELLHRGFGVRVGVHGHDLHGITLGPDGRIYFSVGDRGFDVTSKEGTRFHEPTRGAVFRCEPDGSHLELFHVGLRNPQELAFNDVGDLFTVDNNMSGGDECRILHLLEGADSGWDATYQLSRNFRAETKRPDHIAPPWFTEGLWRPPFDGQPEWVNPAVANLTRGPSGLVCHPGVGPGGGRSNRFFVADFVGSAANSGIIAFDLEPKGAGYELVASDQFVWNVLATDVDFAPDGSMLIADFIQGWAGTDTGRIWRITDPANRSPQNARELNRLSAEDFLDRSTSNLAALLSHPDRRIRLRSELALTKRPDEWRESFLTVLVSNAAGPFAHLHAIWGLEIIARHHPKQRSEIAARLIEQLGSQEAETRVQAVGALGSIGKTSALQPLLKSLDDPSARVRYHAAMALGKLGVHEAVQPLVRLLRDPMAQDRSLRHAIGLALSRTATGPELAQALSDREATVRLGAVLALRHQASPALRHALHSKDTVVVSEAVRAIHDLPVMGGWAEMASMLDGPDVETIIASLPVPVVYRLLNANFRLGGKEHAERVAAIAANRNMPAAIRTEALDCLAHWRNPSPFDRATWHHRPLPERSAPWMAEVVRPPALAWTRSLGSSSDTPDAKHVLASLTRLIGSTGCLTDNELLPLLADERVVASTKIGLLESVTPSNADTMQALDKLLVSTDPMLQATAALKLALAGAREGWTALDEIFKTSRLSAQRLAIETLTKSESPKGVAFVQNLVDELESGDLPDDLALDLIERGKGSTDREIRSRLSAHEEQLAKKDSMGIRSLALESGDSERGQTLFNQHAAQCVRCHRIDGFGGQAGPDLSNIGSQLSKRDLLVALVDPQARIAPGFGTTQIELADGETIAGVVMEETADAITLRLPDDTTRRIERTSIKSQQPPFSGMPQVAELLTPLELRDLVTYLSTRR